MLNEILQSFVLSSGKKLFYLHEINSLMMSLESADFYTLAQFCLSCTWEAVTL